MSELREERGVIWISAFLGAASLGIGMFRGNDPYTKVDDNHYVISGHPFPDNSEELDRNIAIWRSEVPGNFVLVRSDSSVSASRTETISSGGSDTIPCSNGGSNTIRWEPNTIRGEVPEMNNWPITDSRF